MDRRALLTSFAAIPLLAAPSLSFAQAAPEKLIKAAASAPVSTSATPQIEMGPVTFPEGSTWPIAERFYPREVQVKPSLTVGSIIVVSEKFFLYHVFAPGRAMRYGVAVGTEELVFRGDATIQRKVEWPSWRPTQEMIERNPQAYKKYEDGMPGGPTNPLGARALYLYQNGRDTAIRIHGTTSPSSIGHAASNGCLRMVNEHVIALFDRVPLGTPVTVY
jgi:lipoprotein-anchoring transpeptidase ErfK/SrfK